ncbi:MAG TPA: ABC transporter ATP-binding protein [Methanothermobacter sp.]|nr:ABC transporter related protein [Methanothermobacter sp. MT-2]HHW05053.1 ABC transporter ATP-binding protein [Methanothermobacter sp.]HOK72559.1 ABC transporter ATP-binding protein [Methanothermobacter sp.]HOL69378.1 ABC transporter ATP-binding protein [Methanothermobacter sp.]HPQ04046.1 ABC transporter ATP-binding protein [Methanothermobacter sp.]
MEKAVEIKNLHYKINNKTILEDINLKIYKREFLAIIGPNGGGKTTLLKMIIGLLKPTKGNIKVFGLKPETARKKIGYLPQRRHFDTDFPINVFETVLMGCYHGPLKGYTRKDKEKVDKWLKRLEIDHLKDERLDNLSGGQLQRVFLARALVREGELLLLDEPTSSVDPLFQEKFYELLDELKHEIAIVMVSHDIGMVATHVDRIACLNQKLFSHGTPEEALECIEDVYKCPVELIAHGVPHRVLRKH